MLNMLKNLLTPKYLKELIGYLPGFILNSLNWKEILFELGPSILKSNSKSFDISKLKNIKELEESGIYLMTEVKHYQLKEADYKEYAKKLILLYFLQFKNEGIVFDMRKENFSYQNNLIWAPKNTWYVFSKNFRESIIELYKGYYNNDQSLYINALEKLNLTTGLDKKKKDELYDLFNTHFGPGDQKEVLFSIEKFQSSFSDIFKFFSLNKVSIDKDFAVLGIYLASLYSNLEELNTPVDVRDAFNKANL